MCRAYLSCQKKERKVPLNEGIKENRKDSCEYTTEQRKRPKTSLITSERGHRMNNDSILQECSLFKSQLAEK